MLAHPLKGRFAAVQVTKIPLTTSWAVALQVAQRSFAAVLGKSKYGNDEWILLIEPPDAPRFLDRIRGHKSVVGSPELIQTCREIHAVLTTTQGISAVRWYFEGPRNQTAAVATPDELPWIKSDDRSGKQADI